MSPRRVVELKIGLRSRGILCFRHRGCLYKCLTFNFGARASSYYWARAAGLLCRQLRKIIFVSHGLLIYVDDLLCLLRKCACPMLASLVVILLLALNVPMSWHKASRSILPPSLCVWRQPSRSCARLHLRVMFPAMTWSDLLATSCGFRVCLPQCFPRLPPCVADNMRVNWSWQL